MRSTARITHIALLIVAGGVLACAGWTAAADEVAPGATCPDVPAATQPTQPAAGAGSVSGAYPGLASSALLCARLAELPDHLVLRAGDVEITSKDIEAEVLKSPQAMRSQLRRNGFAVLEQAAVRPLMLAEARAALVKAGKDPAAVPEEKLMQAVVQRLTGDIQVGDVEVAAWYQANQAQVGGRSLEEVRAAILGHLLQQKQEEVLQRHIRTLGQRVPIEVSARWAAQQAERAKDNPVDRARASGRPSLVDFGSTSCLPCQKLEPILAELTRKYQGRANVVFVNVGVEQALAARYGIEAIPVQVFFDAAGREVFRHTGFWPQDQLEQKLAEAGVKPQEARP